jgi:hypothetical protein
MTMNSSDEIKAADELLPCPFCGRSPKVFSFRHGRKTMICMTGGCVGPHVGYYSEGDSKRVALKKWNTRTPGATVKEQFKGGVSKPDSEMTPRNIVIAKSTS